ncbi:hypothetical protein U8607_04565 [Methylobacterium durans]|nr:hypothetical protein [Methylobacterium durans]MEA1831350.1 hypothetical protein [Methylobacterium durans]
MIKSDPHPPSLGSAFDAVLHGVAQGLQGMFPPVEHARPPALDDDQSQEPDDVTVEPAHD